MKKYVIVGVLIVVEVMSLFLLYKSNTLFEDKELENVSITKGKNNMMAMYVQNGENYEEYTNTNTFPEGYTLNMEKSKCIDNNGEEIKNVLYKTEDEKIKVVSNKTSYCYLYFDEKGKSCKFDNALTQGATFIDGQYTYKYMQQGNGAKNWVNITEDGWGVMLTDKDSTTPVIDEEICTSINDKPVISATYMFANSNATSIDVSSFDTFNIKNVTYMFYSTKATEIIGYEDFDTSNMVNMHGMFFDTHIPIINVSKYKTSSVTNMMQIFALAKATQITGYENWDTSNVTDMSEIFCNTNNIMPIDISNWNTSKVKRMYQMFGSAKSPSIKLGSIDTSQVTDMERMFNDSKATIIDGLTNFNTSNVKLMDGMFKQTLISILDLSSFDTTKVTNFDDMFKDAAATTGYAKTQEDANKFNASSNKPETLNFTVKSS